MACSTWYGGIGIGSRGDVLTEVYAGYPAERAGLLVGDVINPIGTRDITGTPGTSVTLRVARGKRVFQITIVRGRICYR